MKLSVSYLSVKKRDVSDVIEMLDKTNADFIHVDVMDGKYVSDKANLFSFVEPIGKFTRKRLDIHFMVNKPLKMIDDYASLNAYCMTYHTNIKNDLDKVIEKTKSYGIKVGLAINPDQDIDEVLPYLDKIDLILVMSVVPGKPGQKFIDEVIPKIKKLRKIIKEEKRDILLSVDGGVNLDNKKELKDCDILVSGSFITNSPDYVKLIDEMKK
jgi:ribulose-phosphate 3-epimerase